MSQRNQCLRFGFSFVASAWIVLGFDAGMLRAQEKLKPLATQIVGEYQVEVWSVDPIELPRLTQGEG